MDPAQVRRACASLLGYLRKREEDAARASGTRKQSLFDEGDVLAAGAIQLVVGLKRTPEQGRAKPIRVPIPHSLYRPEDGASLCVAAAMANGSELARNATVECYWADTANDLRDVGFANALAAFSPSSDDDGSGSVRPTGRERRGETWADLLDGLEPDRPGVAQQGWGPSL